MFFKKWKQKKEDKEICNSILNLSLKENANYTELVDFYKNIAKLTNKYQDRLFNLYDNISDKEKVQLETKISALIHTYCSNMIAVNESILVFLRNAQVSDKTKVDLAIFAKESVEISNLTLEILQRLANIIK